MSNLKAVCPLALTFGSTSAVSKFRYTAPSNQKVWVRFRLVDKGAVASGFSLLEVRRGTTGGTTSGATVYNLNGTDAETFQGSAYTYSSQPNNDGTVMTQGIVKEKEVYVSPPLLLNGGESVDLWITPSSASLTHNLLVELEQ